MPPSAAMVTKHRVFSWNGKQLKKPKRCQTSVRFDSVFARFPNKPTRSYCIHQTVNFVDIFSEPNSHQDFLFFSLRCLFWKKKARSSIGDSGSMRPPLYPPPRLETCHPLLWNVTLPPAVHGGSEGLAWPLWRSVQGFDVVVTLFFLPQSVEALCRSGATWVMGFSQQSGSVVRCLTIARGVLFEVSCLGREVRHNSGNDDAMPIHTGTNWRTKYPDKFIHSSTNWTIALLFLDVHTELWTNCNSCRWIELHETRSRIAAAVCCGIEQWIQIFPESKKHTELWGGGGGLSTWNFRTNCLYALVLLPKSTPALGGCLSVHRLENIFGCNLVQGLT